MTLKDQLISHLFKQSSWIPKGELLETKWYYTNSNKTYMSETVGRKLREAESEGLIAVRDDGKSVEYKYLPESYKSFYIPWSLRPDDNKSQKFKGI